MAMSFHKQIISLLKTEYFLIHLSLLKCINIIIRTLARSMILRIKALINILYGFK